MNQFLNLQATDLVLVLELEPIGSPDIVVNLNGVQNNTTLTDNIIYTRVIPLRESFFTSIELKNKDYNQSTETAVKIKKFTVDDIDMLQFNHAFTYTNDKNINSPTKYLGYNGKWTVSVDKPFYQWLHQITNQGMLIQ